MMIAFRSSLSTLKATDTTYGIKNTEILFVITFICFSTSEGVVIKYEKLKHNYNYLMLIEPNNESLFPAKLFSISIFPFVIPFI